MSRHCHAKTRHTLFDNFLDLIIGHTRHRDLHQRTPDRSVFPQQIPDGAATPTSTIVVPIEWSERLLMVSASSAVVLPYGRRSNSSKTIIGTAFREILDRNLRMSSGPVLLSISPSISSSVKAFFQRF